MSSLAAGVLWIGVVAYAVFAGADFGAGLWDLVAGDAERGARPRALIDHAITPVWEANHVWLVFCLVMLWTAFTTAFVAIMHQLALPLWIAAVGIVLRGSGFAFRKVATRTAHQRLYGAAFAASSVITPFAMGMIAGAIASGRLTVPPNAPVSFPWWNPTSVMGGVLAVATCAYLAGVYLVADANRVGDHELAAYFTRRAIIAAFAAGVVALAGIFVLYTDAHHIFERLAGRALPIVLLSVVAGLGALWALRSGRISRAPRALATIAVASIVGAWGVAQYPDLLPGQLTIQQAASPDITLVWLVGIAVAAVVIVVPAFAVLYALDQRNVLES
ncbi:MAG TPA: cytochrome d ubiquinol oxidase subunit II [Acidimicrobiia bacterium]